jgi:hypothetical protein
MGQVLLTNNAYTTLAVGCASGDLTLTVTSSSTFPAVLTASGNWFYACLQDTFANLEIVKVTNVTGTTWTVTRAVGGTSARAFIAGSVVELRVTAETLNDVTTYNVPTAVQNSAYQYIASVAGTNTITGTLTPTPSAYVAGQMFRMVAAGANTGATTLNLNGLGAKAVTFQGANALAGGEILAGGAYELIYDGTQFQLVGSFASGPINGVSSVNGGQLAGLRNRIINGDFKVTQRGASGTAANTYGPDRWIVSYGTAAPSWLAGVGALPEPAYGSYINIGGVASNTGVNITQRIEAVNCRDMAGKNVTVSYYVYQTTGATVTVTTQLQYASAVDTWPGSPTSITPPAGTAVPTATWVKISHTFSVPTAATTGFSLTPYANFTPLLGGQSLLIYNVQLEIGSVATPFEQRPYGMELVLCQRYYEQVEGTLGTQSDPGYYFSYRVTKRTTPTITWSAASGTLTPLISSPNVWNGFSTIARQGINIIASAEL